MEIFRIVNWCYLPNQQKKYKHPCFVTLYRHQFKDQVRHYVKFEPKSSDDEPNSSVSTPLNFKYLHNCHWQIETYHRTIQQCWGQHRIRRKQYAKEFRRVFLKLIKVRVFTKCLFSRLLFQVTEVTQPFKKALS